jgi:hypothetical protein
MSGGHITPHTRHKRAIERCALTVPDRLVSTLSGHFVLKCERRHWAESAPTLVASGRTGVSAKAATPLRAAMVTILIIALRSDSGDSARESEAEARPNR